MSHKAFPNISGVTSEMSLIPEQKGFFGKVADSVSRAFVPPKDPKEIVQQWTKQIRSEGRSVDRSVRGMYLSHGGSLQCQWQCLACAERYTRGMSCRIGTVYATAIYRVVNFGSMMVQKSSERRRKQRGKSSNMQRRGTSLPPRSAPLRF